MEWKRGRERKENNSLWVSHFVCEVRDPRKTSDGDSVGNILTSPQPCQRKQVAFPSYHHASYRCLEATSLWVRSALPHPRLVPEVVTPLVGVAA